MNTDCASEPILKPDVSHRTELPDGSNSIAGCFFSGAGRLLGLGFSLILVVTCAPVFGAPVETKQAELVVRGWLGTDAHPLGAAMGNKIQGVETIADASGEPLYHVVELEPSGFVIVPGDDRIEPVICFASNGRFDPSPANSLGALVSRDLPNRMDNAKRITNQTAASLACSQKWQRLQSLAKNDAATNGVMKDGISSVSDLRIAPLLQTYWSQATAYDATVLACYNYYTPPYGAGNDNNYVCGCVATAMAQLMRFWQYPTAGVGTGTYTIYINDSPTTAQLRGGDGSGGAYNWASMPTLAPGGADPTTAQCQAIGDLTYDAGVAVNMDYTYAGSGAYTSDAQSALVSTFSYGNAVMGGSDEDQDNIGNGLMGMVNPNLDAHCPVVFGIDGTEDDTGETSGHEIVCDGYGYSLSTLYHHLNLGWSGLCNAWYALPYVDASENHVTYTSIDGCIYNVFTNGSGEIISGRVLDSFGSPIVGAMVSASRAGGGSYSAETDANGIYALVRLPSASTYSIAVSQTGYSSSNATYSTGTSSDFNATSGNYWGANFTMTIDAGMVDHFVWNAIASPQSVSNAFTVTITAQTGGNATATNFAGTVNLGGEASGVSTNTMLNDASLSGPVSSDFDWTMGYAFTPNVSLQVTGLNYCEGAAVAIWTEDGTLVASQSVSSVPGIWRETPLTSPVTLAAGTRYRIGVYCPAGTTYYYVASPPASFNNGTIDGGYCGAGTAFPNMSSSYLWAVDLIYTAETTYPVAINPSASGNFDNGSWTGNISVRQAGSNVIFTANDGAGHTGSSASGLIILAPPSSPSITCCLSGNHQVALRFNGAPNYPYILQAATNLAPPINWQPVVTNLTDLNGCWSFTISNTAVRPRQFFRVFRQ